MTENTIPRHPFTAKIEAILRKHFRNAADDIFKVSPLLGYLNSKTKAASRGSKARSSFANHYALYVVVEDYIKKGYAPGGPNTGRYDDYEGARFSDLFRRQRKLPFGQKLQNHALNARLNDEFRKFYPSVDKEPIVRDVERQRYWVHEDLLNVDIRGADGKRHRYNLAYAIIDIIDAYIAAKKEAFEGFIQTCKAIAELASKDVSSVVSFIQEQLQPNVDARVFEIVSFALLKAFYGEQSIFWGWTRQKIIEESLTLYKTGRTNANDGGIDFVMRPLGRFFQVTETIDVNKYFLDIDKIQRFPLTFVVKSNDPVNLIVGNIRQQAVAKYRIKAVVNSYMNAVEEVINSPRLLECLNEVVKAGKVSEVMNEIIVQSEVEFNYSRQEDSDNLIAQGEDE